MRIDRIAIAIVGTLALAGITDLAAQRRTTGGSSSGGGRQQPSGGGQRGSSGGGQRGSSGGERASSGGTATRRGGDNGERATPRRGDDNTATTRARGADALANAPEPGGARASTGKIGAVRDRARAAADIRTSRGVRRVRGVWIDTCWSCNSWGWHRGYWGWYHGGWWYPAYYPRFHRPDDEGEAREVDEDSEPAFGQTYLDYPYAGPSLSGSTFVQNDAPGRRGYGTLSGQFFGDRESEVQAGRFSLQGVHRLFHGEFTYAQYVEPIAGGTDRLQTWHATAGVQPRLGDRASLLVAAGIRGVDVRGGGDAYGPEAELGLRVLPVRPLGINLNGRLASLSWTGDDYFTFREVDATGSVFVGRIELQAGWHYMKVGSAPAFTGPVAGIRVWF